MKTAKVGDRIEFNGINPWKVIYGVVTKVASRMLYVTWDDGTEGHVSLYSERYKIIS